MNARPVRALAGAICACLMLVSAPSAAHPVRAHIVARLLLDGREVKSAGGVTVTRGSTTEHALHRGEAIVDGTRIDVPAHLVVVITSTGGKSMTTLEPGSSVTFVSTGSGELVSSNGGASVFSVVPHTLDFFRVQSGESLTASVHGTVFSVDTSTPTVTYSCREGEVNITKTGYVLIGQQRLQTALIDVISAAATSEMTYHPRPNWTLAKFANFRAGRGVLPVAPQGSAPGRRRGCRECGAHQPWKRLAP